MLAPRSVAGATCMQQGRAGTQGLPAKIPVSAIPVPSGGGTAAGCGAGAGGQIGEMKEMGIFEAG